VLTQGTAIRLRGYNLDHGTDLAITIDDVPVICARMPTAKATPISTG
jgi:hypothetical protein